MSYVQFVFASGWVSQAQVSKDRYNTRHRHVAAYGILHLIFDHHCCSYGKDSKTFVAIAKTSEFAVVTAALSLLEPAAAALGAVARRISLSLVLVEPISSFCFACWYNQYPCTQPCGRAFE